MSSILELAKLVGQQGLVQAGQYFKVQVQVLDVAIIHGRTRVLVQPLAGSGNAWIDLSLLILDEDGA